MQPQGAQPVNTDYFKSLTDQVNAVANCADLQALTNEAYASVTASIKGVEDQIALLAPMLSLLNGPSVNPADIVSWITSFISSFITPLVKPYETYTAQLAELVAQMSSIAGAIAAKASSFELCEVVVPPISPTPSQ